MVSPPSAVVIVVVASLVMFSEPAMGINFTLTILHTNDVHARFDQFDVNGSPCTNADALAKKCFGGYPRLMTVVKALKSKHPAHLLLDAGDQYQGTLWFSVFGDNVTSHFMNWLGYDVMSLGSHEFDCGPESLASFVTSLGFDVVSANMDASRVPTVRDNVHKHSTLNVLGQEVGVIGYTLEETANYSSPGEIKFTSVVGSVREEVKKLEKNGVNKIIALGHAGFEVDKQLAAIPGVDVVVGGHSNTFLYSGVPPSVERPECPYPYVIEKNDGLKALVVQDFAFGKYLGVLHVTFDEKGQVISYTGNPILLDHTVRQDRVTLAMMAPWKAEMVQKTKKVVGTTLVNLNGSFLVCRVRECNMGNLITDAMVRQNLRYVEGKMWTDVSIALMNGGGIRDSIERGPVTIGDVLNVMPFENTVDAIRIKGKHLREALEYSVSKADPCAKTTNFFGGFLQVSGLRVKYNLGRPVGERVVSVYTRCTECLVPRLVPLQDDAVYKVLLPTFLINGGDGYSVFKEHVISTDLLGDLGSEQLIEYIQATTPIFLGLEGRIKFEDIDVCGSDQTTTTSSSNDNQTATVFPDTTTTVSVDRNTSGACRIHAFLVAIIFLALFPRTIIILTSFGRM